MNPSRDCGPASQPLSLEALRLKLMSSGFERVSDLDVEAWLDNKRFLCFCFFGHADGMVKTVREFKRVANYIERRQRPSFFARLVHFYPVFILTDEQTFEEPPTHIMNIAVTDLLSPFRRPLVPKIYVLQKWWAFRIVRACQGDWVQLQYDARVRRVERLLADLARGDARGWLVVLPWKDVPVSYRPLVAFKYLRIWIMCHGKRDGSRVRDYAGMAFAIVFAVLATVAAIVACFDMF